MRKDLPAEVRRRAVMLSKRGKPIAFIASLFGVSRGTIYKWVGKYKGKRAVANFENQPKSGRPKKHQNCDIRAIELIIRRPASRYGFNSDLWNSSRVALVAKKELGCSFSKTTVWRRLREKGLTYQKCQKRFAEMRESEVHEWTKEELPDLLEQVKESRGILYFGDESKVSLQPPTGKTWARKGRTPAVRVGSKRGGVSVISAINSSGHLQFSVWKKNIAANQVICFCQRLVDHHPRRKIFLILDNASTHRSNSFKSFIERTPRLHVFFTPICASLKRG